jgi:hypothetical protein
MAWPAAYSQGSRPIDETFEGPVMASGTTIKAEARKIVDQLPEDASWEDLIYRLYVRQAIEAGLKDADEGHTVPVEEIRRQFGLQP